MGLLFNSQKWVEIRQSLVWPVITRRFIILGVLGISVLLAMAGSLKTLQLVLLIITGFVGLVVLLLRPALGILVILISGFFIPLTGPGGFNLAVISTALVILLWVLDMLIRQRKIYVIEPITALPILVFVIGSIISFGIGLLPWYPLARQAPLVTQLGGLAIFILSALAFLAVGNLVRDLRWIQIFTWIFLTIGAVYIAGRIFPRVGVYVDPLFQRGATDESIFWVWLLVIPFSQLLLNNKLHTVFRIGLAILVAGVLYVSFMTARDWKSGYVPPLAGVACIIALLLRRRVFWFLPLFFLGAMYIGSQAIATDEYSWFSRLDAWVIVLQLSTISPIFGIGFGNYYWYTPLFPIRGWRVSFNSHSQYVDIFSQVGLFGMICYFWIFWEIGKLGWRLKDTAPDGFARAFVYGAMGGLAGTLVAGGLVDWVLPFVYNIGLNGFRSSILSWLFLGGLLTINQLVKEKAESDRNYSDIGRVS